MEMCHMRKETVMGLVYMCVLVTDYKDAEVHCLCLLWFMFPEPCLDLCFVFWLPLNYCTCHPLTAARHYIYLSKQSHDYSRALVRPLLTFHE